MAESEVEICNQALILMGSMPIMTLDDGTKTANLCKILYPQVRDENFRSYPFNSIMRRASLAADVDVPAFGYERQFPLPEGPNPPFCLKVHKLNGEEKWNNTKYKIEGRMILTNEVAPLEIIYHALITDPRQYDVLLCEAIATRLATKLTMSITESSSRTQLMDGFHKDVLRRARMVDAMEGTPDDMTMDTWMQARM